MLRPVLRTKLTFGLWERLLVAALAASRWTNWFVHCCCVSGGGTLDLVPVIRLDSDPLAPA